MGLLSLVFGLPLAPVRGVIKLGEVVQRQVEEQQYHPASVRRDLEGIADERATGRLSEQEAADAEQQVLNRMIGPPRPKER